VEPPGPSSGSETEHTALVVAGGDPVDALTASRLPDGVTTVVVADSGLHHALTLGRSVDVIVGDLDSADPVLVERAEAAGTAVERHPVEKDATDLELALVAARDRGATRIVVAGLAGGRADHLFANVLLLAAPRFTGVRIEAWLPGARLTVVRGETHLHGRPGDLLSLLPVGGAAEGVRTEGLQYPLRDEDLEPGSTRGVSNVFEAPEATVVVARGCVLAIQPDGGS
jgi:thiamine pyrophosphokinase